MSRRHQQINRQRSRPDPGSGCGRWWTWWLCALLASVAGSGHAPLPAEEAPVSEYRVKAVWLLNFARFVEWPASAFPAAHSPFVVGLLGKDPFGKELEKALEGKMVKGRSFRIKRVSSDPEMRGCHILFVSGTERRRSRDFSEKLRGAAVLSVGEWDEFLDQGGVI